MKLTIESTPVFAELDGVACRIWKGTTEGGAPVEVLVRGITADAAVDRSELEAEFIETPEPVHIDVAALAESRPVGERNRAHIARDLLIEWLGLHEARCTDPNCGEKANLLGWLAHCLGATKADLQRLPTALLAYDLECQKLGGCDSHMAKAEPQT